jgi:hypothetical protein
MEVAAQTLGYCEKINASVASQHALGYELKDVPPGSVGNDWTQNYTDRDAAVKAGVGTTMNKSGRVIVQNVITFYHPDSVQQESNSYRDYSNISKIQNILDNIKSNFESSRWLGISVVSDVKKVTSTLDKEKVRDMQTVRGDCVALAEAFEAFAWLFESAYTIENLSVTLRGGGRGFDVVFPCYLSTEGVIFNNIIKHDINVSVLV